MKTGKSGWFLPATAPNFIKAAFFLARLPATEAYKAPLAVPKPEA
jgi:hypothetical protein